MVWFLLGENMKLKNKYANKASERNAEIAPLTQHPSS
ncbi:hypothetical protein J3R74_000857 [Puniceicoccus vermicola]